MIERTARIKDAMNADMRRPISKVMYYDTPFMHPSRGIYMEVYDNLRADGEYHTDERVASGHVANLSFDWTNSAPYGASSSENYLVKWFGYFRPEFTGTYKFFINKATRDSIQMWVGGGDPRAIGGPAIKISAWDENYNFETSGFDMALTEGAWKSFRIEYRHRHNEGRFSCQYREPMRTQNSEGKWSDYDPCVYYDGTSCTNATCSGAFWGTKCINGISYQTYASKAQGHQHPIEAYKVIGADICSYREAWILPADAQWVSGHELPYISAIQFSKKLGQGNIATLTAPMGVIADDTDGYQFSAANNCYSATLSGGFVVHIKPNRLIKIHAGYSGPCLHYNNGVCNVGHTASGTFVDNICSVCGNPACKDVVASGADMPVVFTGFVAPYKGDRQGLSVEFTVYDFMANLSDTIIGNVPSQMSYNNGRYFAEYTTASPDGKDRPLCYDGWAVSDAIRDLAMQAGFSATQLYATRDLTDNNGNVITGYFDIGGHDIVLPKQPNYGNPNIYADEAAEPKDDKYLWAYNFDTTPKDAINRIAEAYGMHMGVDAEGNLKVSTYNDYRIFDDNFVGWAVIGAHQGGGTHYACITSTYTQQEPGKWMVLSGVTASKFDIILYLASGNEADDRTTLVVQKDDTEQQVYSTTLPAYYNREWAYLDGIDSSTGQNPCVVHVSSTDIMEAGDTTPLDQYKLLFAAGGARIDAVIAYLEDTQYPLYRYSSSELVSGDIMTAFDMTENYDDIRNDVVVVGAHKGYVTYQGKPLNENNKVNKYVFSRATSVDSIVNIDNAQSLGKKQSMIIFEPGIKSKSHADWLSTRILAMYNQATHTPSIGSAGNPFLEPNDPIYIVDSGQNIGFLVWVSNVDYEMKTSDSKYECTSKLTVSPHEPWPSYKPSLYGDLTRYTDDNGSVHGFVNVSITDSNGDVRMNTEDQVIANSFSMYEAEGSSIHNPSTTKYLRVRYNQIVPGYVTVKIVSAKMAEQARLYNWGTAPYKEYKQILGDREVAFLVGDIVDGVSKPEYRDVGEYTLFWDATDELNATHSDTRYNWHISSSDDVGGLENLYVAPGRYKVVLEIQPTEYTTRMLKTETDLLPSSFNNPSEGISVGNFYKVFWDIWRFQDDRPLASIYLYDKNRASDGDTGAGVPDNFDHITWFTSEDNRQRGSHFGIELFGNKVIGEVTYKVKIPRLIDYKISVSHFIYTLLTTETDKADIYPPERQSIPNFNMDYTYPYFRKLHTLDTLITMPNVVTPKDFCGFKPVERMVDFYYRPDEYIGGSFRFEEMSHGAYEHFVKHEAIRQRLDNEVAGNVYMHNAHAIEYNIVIVDKSGFIISGVKAYVRDAGSWKFAGRNYAGASNREHYAQVTHQDLCDAGDRWWPNMMGLSAWRPHSLSSRMIMIPGYHIHTWWKPSANSVFAQAGTVDQTTSAVSKVDSQDGGGGYAAPDKTWQRIFARCPYVEYVRTWGPVEIYDWPPSVVPT